MVAQHVAAVDSSFNNVTDFSLADGFFNSSAFRDDRNFVEKTTRGQIVEPAQAWDPAFNRVIKDELMDEHLDLVSLNIQRGRDHGITGYNSYREACGIQTGGQYDRVDTFEQLTSGGFLLPLPKVTIFSPPPMKPSLAPIWLGCATTSSVRLAASTASLYQLEQP